MDISTALPMRKPSKIPFFTQALTRQPVSDAGSGSAARTSPRFRAPLKDSKVRRCSSVYCGGGKSNSCSISDGSIGFLDEAERFQNGMNAPQGTCARRHQGKAP